MPARSAFILALLPFVLSQSSSTTGSVTQAIAASTPSLSIDPSLPQTPLTTVPSFTIPYVNPFHLFRTTANEYSNLSALTSGAPSDATVALDTTYTASAQPTKVTGAPALPNIAAISPSNYPALDVTPPTDSAQVKEWLSQIDFSKVPNYGVTDGTVS